MTERYVKVPPIPGGNRLTEDGAAALAAYEQIHARTH